MTAHAFACFDQLTEKISIQNNVDFDPPLSPSLQEGAASVRGNQCGEHHSCE